MATAFSSSSSSSSSTNYDVFLSFRGETRENFTSHLFAALDRKQIYTFMDEAINKGDKISPELLNAIIEGSKISVIIFSKDYASSKWCLDELVKILQCKEKLGQIVIPVFFHVHPSDVRKQTGDFGKAFGENEKRFKNVADKVQIWRDALTEASYIAGHESTQIRPEAKLVDVIVKDVLKKLEDTTVSIDSNGLVGINSRIEQVKSLLGTGLQDFRIVGIWGMGGIGKTTLADAIFHQISNDFQGKSFMAKVREESERYGLEHLRGRILSEILEEDIKVQTPNLPGHIKKRLQRMRVLIVLDDVNKLQQLEYLAGGLDRFGAGSKIIVTTRNKDVLEKCGVSNIYKVEGLNYRAALEHFCNHAFRENHCPKDLMVLSERALFYAKGNPLALKVLGSFFYGKSKQDWENVMDNLNRMSSLHISDVLKISYDELDWEVKNIFLDIACFFKGDEKDHMISVCDDPYSINFGVDILVDKSLVTISNNKLEMHDLLQEMGREIVRQESVEEPGKRSRLWHHKDILSVLNKNKGTDAIKGIFLDLSKISDINLNSRAFANMCSLRLLKFYSSQHYDVMYMLCKVHLPQGLEYLPDELRYLYWHGYPLRMLPENFDPENLVGLSLPCSKIEQLCKDKKKSPKLKYIHLDRSQYVDTRILDLLEAPKLERVNLWDCRNLSCISSSIQKFNHLGHLSLSGCTSLKCFPSDIHFRSPITIDLSHCVNLTEFPQISGKIMELNLYGTNIQEVPSSIENLTDLESLVLVNCKRLKILSTSICKLKSLRELRLYSCSKLDSFPEILEKMEQLDFIDLTFTAIKELPSSIENVRGLQKLYLSGCFELQLPSSITNLNKVEELFFSTCKGLVLPDSLLGVSSLTSLDLGDCELTEIPQDIGYLSSLEKLNLAGNNFESLPSSIKHLSKLIWFYLNDCNMLQSLPELPPRLELLYACDCERLQSLPELPSPLQELDASELELLSKQREDIWAHYEIHFDFKNCRKLNENTENNILADSKIWIQHLAVASIKDWYEKKIEEVEDEEFRFPPPCGFISCFPGSRTPEWFIHQSTGSSITIPLSPFCCNRNLTGFAFSAVIAFEQRTLGAYQLELYCSLASFGSGKKCWRFDIAVGYKDYELDHVFLGFGTSFDLHTTVSFDTAVSFDFDMFFYIDEDKEKVKVKRVGVCPLYAHPSKTKPNTFTVNMEPPTEEEYKKLHKAFHSEAGTSGIAISTDTERSNEEEINTTQQQSSFLSQIFQCWGLDCNCLWRIFQPCFEM